MWRHKRVGKFLKMNSLINRYTEFFCVKLIAYQELTFFSIFLMPTEAQGVPQTLLENWTCISRCLRIRSCARRMVDQAGMLIWQSIRNITRISSKTSRESMCRVYPIRSDPTSSYKGPTRIVSNPFINHRPKKRINLPSYFWKGTTRYRWLNLTHCLRLRH
jgi:hypothetical protein